MNFWRSFRCCLRGNSGLWKNLQSSRQITIKSLMLDLSIGHAYRSGCDVGLTRTEFSLLRLLAEHPEQIFSAKELYEALWGTSADGDTGTIRRHIFNLRTKIGADETMNTTSCSSTEKGIFSRAGKCPFFFTFRRLIYVV